METEAQHGTAKAGKASHLVHELGQPGMLLQLCNAGPLLLILHQGLHRASHLPGYIARWAWGGGEGGFPGTDVSEWGVRTVLYIHGSNASVCKGKNKKQKRTFLMKSLHPSDRWRG